MEKVDQTVKHHQTIVSSHLKKLVKLYESYPADGLQHMLIQDVTGGHFQLTRMGWHNRQFVFMVLLHIDIKPDGKIWIQQNNTESLIAEELVKIGVKASDIVIGFRPEHMREATGFAIA